jgi:Amt family ammonium transporter
MLLFASLVITGSAFASEGVSAEIAYYSIDNIILLLCAVLVLFMQAGFAALESGLSPVNNTVNIMFKNLTDLSVGVLLFLQHHVRR